MNLFLIIIIILLIILCILATFILYKINSTVNKKLSDVQTGFTQHLTSSQNTLVTLAERLSDLKAASLNIIEAGKDIQNLQDILRVPKLRGNISELLLEQILREALPAQFYKTQYKFSNGNIVDAIVKLKDSKILCIDAKFPLESIKEHLGNGSKTASETPSQFIRDVKKHIDSISEKYILPEEGTLDIALMYIPAENVYYEIMHKEEKIPGYAREKHVIIVSPNSLYLYLSVILTGLKGFEIEKNARGLLSKLSQIKFNLNSFLQDFNIIGTHLTNAKVKYESSKEAIISISEKLKDIEMVESINIRNK